MILFTHSKKYIAFFLFLGILLGFLPTRTQGATIPWIGAETAIVIEESSGRVLYEKNADQLMVPASMTKVMTCFIIFEEIYAGNLSLQTRITVKQSHANLSKNFYNSTSEVYPANTTITVDTLLKMILLPSSCVACIIAAEYISGSQAAFVTRMNETAERLSIEAAYSNCHGFY